MTELLDIMTTKDYDDLRTDIQEVKSEVGELRSDIAVIKQAVENLDQDIRHGGLVARVAVIEQTLHEHRILAAGVSSRESRMSLLEQSVKQLQEAARAERAARAKLQYWLAGTIVTSLCTLAGILLK